MALEPGEGEVARHRGQPEREDAEQQRRRHRDAGVDTRRREAEDVRRLHGAEAARSGRGLAERGAREVDQGDRGVVLLAGADMAQLEIEDRVAAARPR